MSKEVIETGKTVEDAINSACAKLGCQREDALWEIIDLPKKTLLGLKMAPAKVKVWIETDEPEQKPAAPVAVSEKKEAARQEKPAQEKPVQKADKPQLKVEKPARQPDPIEMTEEIKAKTALATQYLQSICRDMGLEAELASRMEDGGVCIEAKGQGLGAIIGRRGETLDALQYLAGLVANRLDGEYLRITLDCGDYRLKRKETLESLARKLSAQVIKTNISKMLEPMNPFERRIIHATVSEIEGVSSTSVGEEPNRRVLITTPTSKRGGRDSEYDRGGRGERRGGDRGRDRRSGGHQDRGGRSTMGGTINTLPQNRPAPKAAASDTGPKQTPEASGDKPLYAKLDLE